MSNRGKRAFELLEKLAFVRTAGSKEELQAAQIIKEAAESHGVCASIEDFKIDESINHVIKLKVVEPYEKEYTATAFKCCSNTPPEGITTDFIYIEDAEDVNLVGVEGKIVMVNGFLRLPTYKKLMKANIAGLITMSGTLLDKEDETDLFTRKIRSLLQNFGNVPAANIRISDAFEMVNMNASRVSLTIENEPTSLTSQNVTATIKGKKNSEQIISFGAHYDSTEFSCGVYDNASGSVLLMELLQYFTENQPDRTLVFNWYGSEEIGLEGSKAYVRDHSDEMKNHIFMINVDVAGPVLGKNCCNVTASKSFTAFTDMYMKSKGHAMRVKQDIYSSDSIPFADIGIPAVNFSREGAPGAAYIHCRDDKMWFNSQEGLESLVAPLIDYCELMVNAVAFPEKREMAKEMIEKIDEYLFKKELESLKKDTKEDKEENV